MTARPLPTASATDADRAHAALADVSRRAMEVGQLAALLSDLAESPALSPALIRDTATHLVLVSSGSAPSLEIVHAFIAERRGVTPASRATRTLDS